MEPEVRLVNAFRSSLETALAAAKTCYSASGVIAPDSITVDEKGRELAKDLLQAGHLTVYQHIHFQFALSRVSRACVWSFLHSHPFYNSEQVSQRFVKVKRENVTIPPFAPADKSVFLEAVEKQMDAYEKLIAILTPITEKKYYRIFPGRNPSDSRWRKQPERRAMEIARYVLPIATHTYLLHTINAVTLFRYFRLCQQWDTPQEQKNLVSKMVGEVLRYEAEFQHLLFEPIPLEDTLEYRFFAEFFPLQKQDGANPHLSEFREEFDRSLNGYVSRLISYQEDAEQVVANAVREVFGIPKGALSDEDAISSVVDPEKNPYLGSTLDLASLSKMMRVLNHPSYTFRKKLSHTADSQDQRHRMTPASRPVLIFHFDEQPDYLIPPLVLESKEARMVFQETMEWVWEKMVRLLKAGAKREYVQYLLPNAFSIRFTESSSFLHLLHKLEQRLCVNAQEEIWRASRDEALQIHQVHPRLGRFLLAPCGVRKRAGITPFCPEGKRYCGVPIWKYALQEYERP
ncbi:MAG: FAD-dependent thymidylate synthase [bacterium JZ-2024 1]